MNCGEFEVSNDVDQIHFINEWDLLAPLRSEQKTMRRDISYHNVLKPLILESLARMEADSRLQVIDIGCGTGDLTRELNKRYDAVGVDPSEVSIRLARSQGGATFEVSTAEEYARVQPGDFDVAVANMVLMDTPNLVGFLSAVHKLLAPSGKFIATITHPWGWPQYSGYHVAPWFDYMKETFIKGPWKISTDLDGPSQLMSTHVHRPLSGYAEAAKRAGFGIETLTEAGITINGRHGQQLPFSIPKFLFIEFRRL